MCFVDKRLHTGPHKRDDFIQKAHLAQCFSPKSTVRCRGNGTSAHFGQPAHEPCWYTSTETCTGGFFLDGDCRRARFLRRRTGVRLRWGGLDHQVHGRWKRAADVFFAIVVVVVTGAGGLGKVQKVWGCVKGWGEGWNEDSVDGCGCQEGMGTGGPYLYPRTVKACTTIVRIK